MNKITFSAKRPWRNTKFFFIPVILLLLLSLPQCTGKKEPPQQNPAKNQEQAAKPAEPSPQPDKKGFQSLPAEEQQAHLQAKAKAYQPPEAATRVLPFDPADWKTNDQYDFIGDPAAQKGGQFTRVWEEFPPNLRTDGPNSNLIQTATIHNLIYEGMLNLHTTTLKFIPNLATHWKISEDKRTFWFRLNPKARFSDGSEVTSDDVYWSFWHLTEEDRQDPYNRILFHNSFETPEIIDKYTIKVQTKKLNWRLFLYFSASMKIFPAEYIRISGEEYLAGYQWRFMPGSGPYIMNVEDLKKPTELALIRRPDWWGRNERWATGLYNFDRLRFLVVSKRELEFEKFKANELDYYRVSKAQRWVEECNFESVQKGWVKKRRIKTEAPQGYNGFCFNMRKPPFNDRRVRMAWAYLYNREKLMEELFFNQYDFIDSCYPGRSWANPDNPKVRYNPRKAALLLKEAGYTERNKHGVLVGPDGKPFHVTLEITSDTMKRIFTTVIKDYRRAGIDITLKRIDFRTRYKKVSDRQFTVTYQWWGAITFPNPESSWHSNLADEKNNNNLSGYRSNRVDKICDDYNVCFDQDERVRQIRAIDGIICNDYPYAFGWFSNRERILYWDKFGHPARYFSRTGDYRDILSMWWIDPDREKGLKQAMAAGKTLEQGTVEVQPWDDLGEQKLPDDE